MKRFFLGLAIAASMGVPLAAGAQSAPAPPDRVAPPERMGPPPEVRAKFEKIKADAKVAALNALSADHRSRVAAIVANVIAGSVMPRDGADQIDALLTSDEKRGVLAAAHKAHEDMRVAMGVHDGDGPRTGLAPNPGPPGGLPPPGAPMAGPPAGSTAPQAPPPGDRDRNREMRHMPAPDAGRWFLMMSLSRDQMHALRAKAAAKT